MSVFKLPPFDPKGPCTVHAYHWPPPLRVVTHHIQPIEMGGLDVDSNKVRVCDTGHYNIHRSMSDLYRQTLDILVGKVRGTGDEKALARLGFIRWSADGKPGKFVFEDHPHLTGAK